MIIFIFGDSKKEGMYYALSEEGRLLTQKWCMTPNMALQDMSKPFYEKFYKQAYQDYQLELVLFQNQPLNKALTQARKIYQKTTHIVI